MTQKHNVYVVSMLHSEFNNFFEKEFQRFFETQKNLIYVNKPYKYKELKQLLKLDNNREKEERNEKPTNSYIFVIDTTLKKIDKILKKSLEVLSKYDFPIFATIIPSEQKKIKKVIEAIKKSGYVYIYPTLPYSRITLDKEQIIRRFLFPAFIFWVRLFINSNNPTMNFKWNDFNMVHSNKINFYVTYRLPAQNVYEIKNRIIESITPFRNTAYKGIYILVTVPEGSPILEIAGEINNTIGRLEDVLVFFWNIIEVKNRVSISIDLLIGGYDVEILNTELY